MAAREPPWTTHEKNALLAEIIKVNNPPPQFLFNVVAQLNVQPRLEEIPLPSGRSLASARSAFEELRRQPQMAMAPGPMGLGTPSPLSAPLTLGKRHYPFENVPSIPAREIRPKPATGGPYGQPISQIDQPPKKKRGRPTKAEAQAKAEAQSMAGESSSAPRPVTAVPPMSTPVPVQPPEMTQPVQTPMGESRPMLPAVSRMNISSMLAGTPTGPGSASHSSSSSGKRRRGRSTRSDPGDVQMGEASGGRDQPPEYESPYRTFPETLDSPARAAMLRRREEAEPPPQPRQGPAQQPPGPPQR